MVPIDPRPSISRKIDMPDAGYIVVRLMINRVSEVSPDDIRANKTLALRLCINAFDSVTAGRQSHTQTNTEGYR